MGVEVLYWLPWVRHLLQGVPIDQVYALTRGGAGPWYGLPDGHALDLFDLRSVDECRRENLDFYERYHQMKPIRLTPWDRRVLEQAERQWGLPRPLRLTPPPCMRAMRRYWQGQSSVAHVLQQTQWDALPKPELNSNLPPKFTAVRFYARATLKPTTEVVRAIQRIMQGLVARGPVVVLQNPHHVDDHVDLPVPAGEQVFVLPAVPPSQTLAQHTAVLAHAERYVGTYGGTAQLALRLGVPSLSLYESLEGTFLTHKYLSDTVAASTGVPFYAMRLQDLPLWSPVWDGLSSRR